MLNDIAEQERLVTNQLTALADTVSSMKSSQERTLSKLSKLRESQDGLLEIILAIDCAVVAAEADHGLSSQRFTTDSDIWWLYNIWKNPKCQL